MQILFLPILAAALFVCGCGRTPEALITQQIAILDQAGEALATINDEESAKAAAPQLANLRRQLDRLIPRVKALKITPKQQEDLEERHREKLHAALEKYESQLARVLKLELKVGGLSDLEEAIAE
jgi:hypothetical protein